jgi:hypothetical protein
MANINSGTTLDITPTPGQDLRFAATASDSIFSFGNFRIDKSIQEGFLDNTGHTLSFSSYATINNSNSNNFDVLKIITTKENELNLPPEDANSYAYFSSFYTKIANAINNIVDNFPYALVSRPINSGTTIYDYSYDLVQDFSTFKIAFSSITNQGGIIYVSGRTEQSEAQIDLYNDTSQFSIQLSGNSQNQTTGTTFLNTIHDILEYNYSINNYLEFKIKGILLPLEITGGTQFNYPILIRPSRQRYGEFNRTLPSLEKQLLNDGTFLVPDSDTDTYTRVKYTWPYDIDEFAPDGYGAAFENYANSILIAARTIDDEKTNIMLRTMLPENYIDLDSGNQIYRKLTTVYAEEFDKIKHYIDGLAYAHSISYNGEESIPNKFIARLANLLGAKLPNSFMGENVIDYLSGEFDDEGKSFEEYNLDLWRRILVNLNWLYKKKGTRDAITFIFKLIGAPECLFNLEEFVYDVKQVLPTLPTSASNAVNGISQNITTTNLQNNIVDIENTLTDPALNGYPDVNSQIFQIGGAGRGNGQEFIDGLGDIYEPTKRVDNFKTQTGDTSSIVNSKEVNVDLRPSRAIECDVMDWYELGYGWWNWGSTSYVFSGLTVPFEWQVEEISTIVPSNMSTLTIHQWLDYIYMSNVNPRDRKTNGYQNGHNGTYMNLKRIYVTYMLWTNNQNSNRLTFRNLEKFLKLLERNFQEFVPFLMPSTTIFDTFGTVYTNSEFNRHRFIYRPGINDGSEFKVELPPVFEPSINAVNFSVNLSNNFNSTINSSNFSVGFTNPFNSNLNISNFNISVNNTLTLNTNTANLATNVLLPTTQTQPFVQPNTTNLNVIAYPTI